jgi:hypothetical protein
MGTSIAMIDVTCRHLAPEGEDAEHASLDDYDANTRASGHILA